jgi:hypothetical protein
MRRSQAGIIHARSGGRFLGMARIQALWVRGALAFHPQGAQDGGQFLGQR